MKMKIGTICHKTGFEKTVIATLLSVVFTQIPTFAAQNIDITWLENYPEKNSISSIVVKDKESGTDISQYGVFNKVQYVAYVQGDKRLVLYFKDPGWSTLEAVNSMQQWNPDFENAKVPQYKNRTVLSLVTSSSNIPEGTTDEDDINSLRFSVFGAFYDGSNNKNKLKAGGFLKSAETDKIAAINEFFSKRSVDITLGNTESGYTYYLADIYGANNDFVGQVDGTPSSSDHKFEINNNIVQINLGNNVLNFERIKGGKAPTWRDLTNNKVKPLTAASNNVIYISSSLGNGEKLDFSGELDGANLVAYRRNYDNVDGLSISDKEFYLKPSIIGGDALKANNNIVYFEKVITEGLDRKFGIIGGRAQDGTFVKAQSDKGANADGNWVIIKNSAIGLINKQIIDSDEQKEAVQDPKKNNEQDTLKGTNIYGGLAYEKATNNVVVISDSTVWGNVQGGVSFLNDVLFGKTSFNWNDYTASLGKGVTYDQILKIFNEGLPEDNAIYLDNAKLVGKSSVYASSGAIIPPEGRGSEEDEHGDWVIPFINSQIVNFRRGNVFVNGKNQASSLYASNVIFGEKHNMQIFFAPSMMKH